VGLLLFASKQGHIEHIFVGSLCTYIIYTGSLTFQELSCEFVSWIFWILPHTCTIAADEIPNCASQQNMFSWVQQEALVHDTCEVNFVVLSIQDKIYIVYNQGNILSRTSVKLWYIPHIFYIEMDKATKLMSHLLGGKPTDHRKSHILWLSS
jgi:hypothetical protein